MDFKARPDPHLLFAFGALRIASSVRLDGLPSAHEGPADVEFVVAPDGTRPDEKSIVWFHEFRSSSGDAPIARCGRLGEAFLVRREDAGDYVVSPAGERVVGRPAARGLEALSDEFVGTALPLALSLAGRIGLHASASLIGDRAVAFVGPSGRGKSTLAAALQTAGLPVLADDYLGLELESGHISVTAGPARIKLRQDSAVAVAGLQPAAPAPVGSAPDRGASRSGPTPRVSAWPLARVYLLEPRATVSIDDGIEIAPCRGAQAVVDVLGQMHRLALDDQAQLTRQLDAASQLVRQGLVRRLSLHGFACLRTVAAAIARDLDRVAD